MPGLTSHSRWQISGLRRLRYKLVWFFWSLGIDYIRGFNLSPVEVRMENWLNTYDVDLTESEIHHLLQGWYWL